MTDPMTPERRPVSAERRAVLREEWESREVAWGIAHQHDVLGLLDDADEVDRLTEESERRLQMVIFLREKRDEAEAEVERLRAQVLPKVEDGCACHYHASNYPIEPPDVEYEPACPVHSEHLYDPLSGTWVLRAALASDEASA